MEFDEGLQDFLIQELSNMGFDEGMARWGLENCAGKSLDDIVTWIFENQGNYSPASHRIGGAYKLMLVVRSDLNMSTGKIAAQCVHAALGVVGNADEHTITQWRLNGEATICVQCGSEDELVDLQTASRAAGLKIYFFKLLL